MELVNSLKFFQVCCNLNRKLPIVISGMSIYQAIKPPEPNGSGGSSRRINGKRDLVCLNNFIGFQATRTHIHGQWCALLIARAHLLDIRFPSAFRANVRMAHTISGLYPFSANFTITSHQSRSSQTSCPVHVQTQLGIITRFASERKR